MLFIDTNIWCYYFDRNSKEHSAIVKYVNSIMGREEVLINNIVIMEIAHYLIKNLGAVLGRRKVMEFLEFSFVIDEFDYEALSPSIDLLAEFSHIGICGRDATILATMKKRGIKKLLTHDKSFRKIDFIEVIDPVK